MQRTECDTCRNLGPASGAGWLALARLPGETASPVLAALAGGGQPELMGTFCSMVCLAEYARARALADSVETGEER